jgi:hypothetical protein
MFDLLSEHKLLATELWGGPASREQPAVLEEVPHQTASLPIQSQLLADPEDHFEDSALVHVTTSNHNYNWLSLLH